MAKNSFFKYVTQPSSLVLPFKFLQAYLSAVTPLISVLGKDVRGIALINWRAVLVQPFSHSKINGYPKEWMRTTEVNEGDSLALLTRSLASYLRLKRRISEKVWQTAYFLMPCLLIATCKKLSCWSLLFAPGSQAPGLLLAVKEALMGLFQQQHRNFLEVT